MEQAGLGRRFSALVLDWLMCLLVTSFIPLHSRAAYNFIPLLLFLAEVAFLTSLQQASAGQKMLNLKVVDFKTGGLVPPLRIGLRTFLICLVLPAIFSKDGRGYHDHFANSIVIKSY
jgi:uncharacterized RDD family membrane protein YckC